MELPLPVRRDVMRYLQIFNDFMDFKILPWHKHGVDKGQMFPVRKTGLRLLKAEIVRFKQKRWDEAHGGNSDSTSPQQQLEEQQQSSDVAEQVHKIVHARKQGDLNQFATRHSDRQEVGRRKTARGESYTEVIHNTAEFPVPEIEDVENWDDNTWKKFASPYELEAHYLEHPEEKPEGWKGPSETLTKVESKPKQPTTT